MRRSSLPRHLATGVLGAALAVSTVACDAPASRTDTGPRLEEVIGTVPARAATLDAVGALGYDPAGRGPFRPVCTATLIAPTRVITAAHCVELITDPAQARFLIGDDASAPIRSVPIRGLAMQSSFTGGAVGIDVAVLHLAEPVTDITPTSSPMGSVTALLRARPRAGLAAQDAP